jgi:hypothetical protein
MSEPAWERAYEARFENSKFGNDAIGIFALGLQFGLDDLEAVGAEIVTGSGDDKKCDLTVAVCVMPALVAGIHVLSARKAWMAGISPAMTGVSPHATPRRVQ